MVPLRSALRRGVAFAHDLATHADRVALLDGEVELTYGELDARVDAVADRLGSTRRLVLLSAANDVDSVIAYLAALRGGHPLLVSGDAPATSLT